MNLALGTVRTGDHNNCKKSAEHNKSPIINWLEYKKLPTPHNLKFPKDATVLEERVKVGTKDGEDLFEVKDVPRNIQRKLGIWKNTFANTKNNRVIKFREQ